MEERWNRQSGQSESNTSEFSINAALNFGWKKITENIGFFLLIGLVYFIFIVAFFGLTLYVEMLDDPLFEYIFILFQVLFYSLIYLGFLRISLNVTDGEKPEILDLFSQYHLLLYYLVLSIIFSVLVLAGLVLLIVPGVIIGLALSFSFPLIVDKNLGPLEALKKSYELTRGKKGTLFLYFILLNLINIGGFCLCYVGLFFTYPMTLIGFMYLYRQLMPLEKADDQQQNLIQGF